jgi:hypothetical protein
VHRVVPAEKPEYLAMNRSQLIALYDQDQRIEIDYSGLRREVIPNVVRHVASADDEKGPVIHSRLTEANAYEVIRRLGRRRRERSECLPEEEQV